MPKSNIYGQNWPHILICRYFPCNFYHSNFYKTEEVSVEIQTGNGTWDATESELTLQFKSDKLFINLRKQDFLSAVYHSREVAKQRD